MKKYIFALISSILIVSGCKQKIKEVETSKKVMSTTKNQPLIAYTPTHSSLSVQHTIEGLYGTQGMNISAAKQQEFISLVTELQGCSLAQEKTIAWYIVKFFEQKKEKSAVNSYLQSYYQAVATQTQTHQKLPHLYQLSQKIIAFLTFEKEHIFTSFPVINKYLELLEKYPLPTLLNPWHTKESYSIINHLQFSSDNQVETQSMLMTIAGMLIQTGFMASSGVANQSISLLQQQVGDQLVAAEKAIATNKDQKLQQAQAQASKTMQANNAAFEKTDKNINKQFQNIANQASAEISYVNKNISTYQTQPEALQDPVQLDQIFQASIMHTPGSALTWRNISPVGDWVFDPVHKTFWQRNLVDTIQYVKDSSGNLVPTVSQANNNAIFAEYYTTQQSYTIAGSFTVYAVSYPFFVGVICNKQRWISGNISGLHASRLVGILGADYQNNQGQPSYAYQLYCAQEHDLSPEEIQTEKNPIPFQPPLHQILHQTVNPIKNIEVNFFTNLITQPALFNFEITTTPEQVSIYIWHELEKKPTTPLVVPGMSQHLFMYHGIGFISSGAISAFTLTSPTDIWTNSSANPKVRS